MSRWQWVKTKEIMPPPNRTVSVRAGGSIFFAAYSPFTRQWVWCLPGGKEERIDEPPEWFCDMEWLAKHRLTAYRK